MDQPAKPESIFSAQRQKLFAALLKKEGITGAAQQPIPRRDSAAPPPLSFAQQRLWVFDQIEPGSSAYNIPLGVRLRGTLNIPALRRSLHALIQRHETLRTTFPAVEGQPIQRIAPPETIGEPALPVIDLRDDPDREATAQRRTNQEAQQPFDLARGPLLRVTLMRLHDDEHLLLLTTHHIVSDGWSQGILIRELTTLYTAFVSDPTAQTPLPELAIQYADFALWQQRWLQGDGGVSPLQQQLAYWQRQLEGAPQLVMLPLDRPRPAVQRFQGTRQSFVLPRRLSEQLHALSRAQDATMFMVLLAAFRMLLYRYSGQQDIVVSTGLANRRRPETESLIGCLINIVLLRTRFTDNHNFQQLLNETKHTILEAQANQDLPFEKLLEALHPVRDPSYSPLTQVMFVLHNAPVAELHAPGLTLQPVVPERAAAQYDLLLHMSEHEGELAGALEYNTTLFDAATITRMLGHFEVLLEGIAAHPNRRIGALALLTEPERRAFAEQWNATGSAYPHDRCLHALIDEQVHRQPDAVALICEDTTLTYAALNERANQLAHYLRTLGVGPNTLVGVCMERSAEVVIAVLGTLKAGGAYVPLDPAYPAERLAMMLEDTAAPVLLTQQRLLDRLPIHRAHTVCLARDWPTIARMPATRPQTDVSPEDLVYVIYTSGSTGRPKAVLLNHRGRVNNFCDFNRRFAIRSQDRLLAVSSLSFDMSAYDILGTLAAGATIVMPAPTTARDPAGWAMLMVRHGVTIWHSAPALLDMLVEYLGKQPERVPHSLRLALLGGDWIPVRLPDQLRALITNVQVISLGGATEVSMDSTIYPIEQVNPRWTSIPYGRPMANQLSYILDAQMEPVPVGVPGELYLGGDGVAWGYLNRPSLTAEKFLPNPFARRDSFGTRIYKTGDRARYSPDGTIELLGRIDHQIKLHGLRIEPGEIEAALSEHHDVEDCVVMAREDTPGDRRLVAYIVGKSRAERLEPRTKNQEPEGGEPRTKNHESGDDADGAQIDALDVQALRQFLQPRLPEYMIPTAFVLLPALPLSPNGKLDRRALPVPSMSRADVAGFVAPRSPTEERLARIWSEVLSIERVGIHDNFFELGGDSLKAIRAAHQIGSGLGLIDLFQHPTVAALAERLSLSQERDRSLLYTLTPPIDSPTLELVGVPYSGGTAIVYQPLARALPQGYALHALLLPGHDINREDEDLPTIAEVAPRCVDEIVAKVNGPLVLFGHCGGAALTIAIARLLEQRSIPIRAVCLGGAFPLPARPRMRERLAQFWSSARFAGDDDLLATVRSLGGFDDIADPAELRFLLRSFRHDGRLALEYFRSAYHDRQHPKLAAPIVCIVGDQDPFTSDFQRRYRQWERFSDTVKLVVIKDAQHYFVKHQAQHVAEIIVGLPTLLETAS